MLCKFVETKLDGWKDGCVGGGQIAFMAGWLAGKRDGSLASWLTEWIEG